MEENLSVEALKAHFLKRDWRTGDVHGCTSVGEGMDAESRPRYCARLSRSFELPPGSRMDASTLNPECLQLSRLSAMCWLMSFFSIKSFITRLEEAFGHLERETMSYLRRYHKV